MTREAKKGLVDFIKFGADGEPYVEGLRCGGCHSVFFGRRTACSKCFARDRMEAFRAPPRGCLYSYTVVYRSFPGVTTPFTHAIVDVEGGGALKGTLTGGMPDPDTIEMGMPVEIYIDDAGSDTNGNRYVSYFFRPDKSSGDGKNGAAQ